MSTYKNPILYADYSDPDVARVGEDYYMVSSSFTYIPCLLYTSGIFKDIGQRLNHLVYRGGLMGIFHGLEIQGLQGIEQKMGINLQLQSKEENYPTYILIVTTGSG